MLYGISIAKILMKMPAFIIVSLLIASVLAAAVLWYALSYKGGDLKTASDWDKKINHAKRNAKNNDGILTEVVSLETDSKKVIHILPQGFVGKDLEVGKLPTFSQEDGKIYRTAQPGVADAIQLPEPLLRTGEEQNTDY